MYRSIPHSNEPLDLNEGEAVELKKQERMLLKVLFKSYWETALTWLRLFDFSTLTPFLRSQTISWVQVVPHLGGVTTNTIYLKRQA